VGDHDTLQPSAQRLSELPVHNALILGQLNEMGGTCSAFGGEKRRMQGLVVQPERKESTRETQA
jgi:hypothetical protein